MIDTLRLEGFQSHKDTDIELDKGVNVIIGSSDSGKSSVIRAMKWLCQNRPQGDSFKNDQLKPKDEVSVCAIFEDDSFVARSKSKSVNNYLTEAGEFKALRSDVPTEVKEVTKMKAVNIQSQHPTEQYFLLADKPGQVAKKFNEVAGLTVMDKATADINSQVRECNAEIKFIEKEIKTRTENIESMKWIPKATKEVKKLEATEKEIITLNYELEEVSDVLADIKETEEELKDFGDIDGAITEISTLSEMNQGINDKKLVLDHLIKDVSDVKAVDLKLKKGKGINKALKALKSLEKLSNKIKDTEDDLVDLRFDLLSYKRNEEEVRDAEKELLDLEDEFHSYLEDEPCPLCGHIGGAI